MQDLGVNAASNRSCNDPLTNMSYYIFWKAGGCKKLRRSYFVSINFSFKPNIAFSSKMAKIVKYLQKYSFWLIEIYFGFHNDE